jgi:tetratricopeptide (TPR) repeat protein
MYRAVLLFLARAASAEPPDEAERLLEEGVRLFTEEAEYGRARDLMLRSYDLRKSWKALNGIALTYQEQGHHVEALRWYERLLAEFGDQLTSEQRGRAPRCLS